MSKKGLKTPLRYPGGKSRACTKMGQFFPELRDYVEFREPFLGGGSVAPSLASESMFGVERSLFPLRLRSPQP